METKVDNFIKTIKLWFNELKSLNINLHYRLIIKILNSKHLN